MIGISKRDARSLLQLLGLLQDHLESAIESSLLPGITEPMPEDAHNVLLDRRDWRAAERMVKKLERELARERNPRRPATPVQGGTAERTTP